jgi:hypothetical protein
VNVLDLTIDQFQRLYSIESNSLLSLPEKRIGACAVVLSATTDQVKALPLKTIADTYKAIQSGLAKMPELKMKQTATVNGKRYKFTFRTDKLKTGQFIDMTFFDFKDENLTVQNLHKVMATLSREMTWYGTQKLYDATTHAQRAEAFRLHGKIADVWGVASFFLLASESLYKISQSYLQRIATKATMDKA